MHIIHKGCSTPCRCPDSELGLYSDAEHAMQWVLSWPVTSGFKQQPSGRGRKSTCRPSRTCSHHLRMAGERLAPAHGEHCTQRELSTHVQGSPQVHWPVAQAEQPSWPEEGQVLHSQSLEQAQFGPAGQDLSCQGSLIRAARCLLPGST